MRTMKLAVSVYALTLVLATNNALGATTFGLGSANPSCDATTFKISYSDNMTGCLGYKSSATNTIDSNSTLTWDGVFKTLATVPTGGGTCLGYELTGWTGNEVKVNNGVLELDTGYTNNSETWNTIPEADGSSEWGLSAVWTATTSTIKLNPVSASVTGSTAVYRKGIDLYSDENYSSRMSVGNTRITVPQRYGYLFKGYYRTSDRATAVGNFWSTGADEYTEDYCKDSARLPQIVWAQASAGGSVDKCPWLASNGEVGNDYVGTAAAKLGTTNLYAAWEPREFTVQYNFNACTTMSGICDDKPKSTTIQTDLTIKDIYGNSDDITTCRYGTGNCEFIDNPTVSTGLFRFTGWEGTICVDNDCLNSPFAVIELSTTQLTTSDLSTIIASTQWKNIDDASSVRILWTAKWTKNNTAVNFYANSSATEPIAVYNAVVDPDATEANKLKFYDSDSEEVTLAPTLEDTTVDGVNYTLRGFVANIDGKTANLASVKVDTAGVPYQSYGTSGLFLVSNADGTFSNKLEHVYSNYNSPMLDALGKNGSINVYGIWAQKCDDADTLKSNKVATCTENIGEDASVSYVITCDPGYNLDGYAEINQ